jgi:hypothetical protein
MAWEQKFEEDQREALNGKVFNHHAVVSDDYVVFGGLQEDLEGAKRVKNRLSYFIDSHKAVPEKSEVVMDTYAMIRRQVITVANSWVSMPVKHIRVGEKYRLYGNGKVYSHGIDDGTHDK